MYRRSLLCVGAVCADACVCMKCVLRFVHICASVQEYVKVYHRNGMSNKHPSLAIFDEHLVRQTNQGLPAILSTILS